jgi:putative peptide zinc metalloprotease protein
MNSNRVRELNSLRPRLRDDLRLSFPESGEARGCVLEDPLRSRFHRLGQAELELIQQFDGQRMFSEAYALASIRSGEKALDEQQAVRFLGWLLDQRLVQLGGTVPEEGLRNETTQRARQQLLQGMNVISLRFPFGSPDRWLQRLRPLANVVCSRWMATLWLAVVLTALMTVHRESAGLTEAGRGVLAPHNWLALGLIWVGLKIWHELAHALTCVYYGGHVREAGVLFILLLPLGYVDASASLAFSSRWKRIHVAAAGVMAELFLAAIALLCWARMDPGTGRYLLFNVALLGSVATLLFNLNPLMRFDGYYILCDLLGIPNLGSRSTAWLSYLGKSVLLGIPNQTPPPKDRHGIWIYVLYGLAALAWRVVILLTLLTAAVGMFGGGGLVFAVLAVLAFAGGKLLALRRMAEAGWGDQIRWPVTLLRIALLVAAGLALFFFPFRHAVVTTGVFQYLEEDIPRPEQSGWVESIYVDDGDQVEPGVRLLDLENPESRLRLELFSIRKKIREIQLRQAVLEGEAPQVMVQRSALESLNEQMEELRSQVESLQLHASTPGRVLTRDLSSRKDMWVGAGTELVRVIRPGNLELRIAIPPEDLQAYQDQIGQEVDILLESGNRRNTGIFTGMAGRATRNPDLPELTAPAGGPIAVRNTADGAEWIRPVFVGRIQSSWPETEPIHAGERAYIRFTDFERQTLWVRSRRWFQRLRQFLMSRAEARRS